MAKIAGVCDDRFAELRSALADELDSGNELGAAICVTVDGAPVVDIWGGWADEAHTTPWQQDTIVNVWSCTKTVTALAALVLIERGELDADAPVARYWPEFAANGKAGVEVRHLLSHTSGVSGLDQPATIEDLYDQDVAAARFAAQAPWWEPGTASGYHALNQGHLVGEVIRRITGQSLGRFVADEICAPLGADFHIGLDPSEFGRVSNVVPPPPLAVDFAALGPDSLTVRTLTGPLIDVAAVNEAPWRQAEIGAANGHGNARSLARLQSVIACGGEVDGVRLLSPATIAQVFRTQSDGPDLVLGAPIRFGLGFGLAPNTELPYLPDRAICFWGGYGGSSVIVDVDNRTVFTYVMNKMAAGILGSDRGARYGSAFFKSTFFRATGSKATA